MARPSRRIDSPVAFGDRAERCEVGDIRSYWGETAVHTTSREDFSVTRDRDVLANDIYLGRVLSGVYTSTADLDVQLIITFHPPMSL